MENKKHTSKKRTSIKKKIVRVLLALIFTLIIVRLLLPTFVKYYFNNALENIPGYHGQISTIDIGVFSGRYVVEGLYLNKLNAKSQIPFLNFPKAVVALNVAEILNGNIVSDIYLESPEIIYLLSDHDKRDQTSREPKLEDWSKVLTEIVPIAINQLKVKNGKFGYVEVNTSPTIDLHIGNIELTASNLRNTRSVNEKLPSSISVTGNTVGGGLLTLEGKMDLIKKIPDIDISFDIKNTDATSLNSFTKHYMGIDFSKGSFEMFGKLNIEEGRVNGLMVPAFIDTKFIGKGDKFLSVLWEGFVGMFKFLLKNHKNNSISMKINLQGDLNKVKTNKLNAFLSMFKHAWIKSFYPKDQSKKEPPNKKK